MPPKAITSKKTSKTSPVVEFLRDLNDRKLLQQIQGEMESITKSPTLLDLIHEYEEDQQHDLNCKRSARECLLNLIEAYVTKQNYKEVATLVKPVMLALTSNNVNIRSQYLSKLNNLYRDKFGLGSLEHQYAKSIFVLEVDEKILKTKQAQGKRLEKNLNPVDILDTTVYRLINAGLLPEADWRDKFIAIALACGARLIEIASKAVSTFSESKEFPGQLNQLGIAKDREEAKEGKDTRRSIDKPVLGITVQQLVGLTDAAREELKATYANEQRFVDLLDKKKLTGQERQQVTQRIDPTLNERVRELLGDSFTFHRLRAVYGNMSFQVFGAGISINAWLSRVLGHKPGSVSTATSYTTVVISKKLNDVPLDVKDSISAFEAQLKAFDERLEQQRKKETVERIQRALDESLYVKLLNVQGQEVQVRKQPRLRDGKQLERLKLAIAELEQQQVSLTYRNLLAMGFGMRVLRDFFVAKQKQKKRKRDAVDE